MATSTTTDDSQWKTGLTIVAVMVAFGAVIGGGLFLADVPGGETTTWVAAGGGVVGAVIGFVAASYFMYGR